MTNASASTQPVELPNRRPGRAARIAAIHMFADWLVAHPDVPIPQHISAFYTADRIDPEPDRYTEIELLAEQLGVPEYGSKYAQDGGRQFDYRIADRAVHGLDIDYRGAALSDKFYRRGVQ